MSRLSAPALPLSLLGGLLTYGFSRIYHYGLTLHRKPLPGLTAPVRVAQLSDLHFGHFIGPEMVHRWADTAVAAQPDLIVITGDFLDSRAGVKQQDRLLEGLARLSAPLGVYAVYGNHDWTSLGSSQARTDYAQRLEALNIHVINNRGQQLRPDLYLGGVDDWWFGQQDAAAMLANREGGATLLLAHNPDYLPHVPPEVTLTLCGHTHGGQVLLPFVRPGVVASLYGTRFLEGWVDTAPANSSPNQSPRRVRGYVSRGLGVTGVPLRLNCPPELPIFDFVPGEWETP